MSHGHDDFETEPVPGLPERLPAGEEMLWQGSPDRKGIARRTFHIRKLTAYAAIMVAWRGITVAYDGGTVAEAVIAAAVLGAVSAVALGILMWMAHVIAKGTIYTITNKRLVMRFGIALPMTVQIPFTKIVSAAARRHGDGSGDIPVTVNGRMSYWVMWPHVRPWQMLRPQPMMRAIPDVEKVSAILGGALKAAFEERADAETISAAEKPQRAAKNAGRHGGQWAAAAG